MPASWLINIQFQRTWRIIASTWIVCCWYKQHFYVHESLLQYLEKFTNNSWHFLLTNHTATVNNFINLNIYIYIYRSVWLWAADVNVTIYKTINQQAVCWCVWHYWLAHWTRCTPGPSSSSSSSWYASPRRDRPDASVDGSKSIMFTSSTWSPVGSFTLGRAGNSDSSSCTNTNQNSLPVCWKVENLY